jgi:mono/diheme cytochrome c family protein
MVRRLNLATLVFFTVLPAFAVSIEVGDGRWQRKVPEAARLRINPMADAPDAIAAGAKLFQQNCASCHGKRAEGILRHPDLRTDRIKNATPGELEWLLKNGSMKNGMPSWSRLPEPQRWQLVTFLKSLN